MSSIETNEKVIDALNKISRLQRHAYNTGLLKIGSSSIRTRYRDTCEFVTSWMLKHYNIHRFQEPETNQPSWEVPEYSDNEFYVGGWRSTGDSKPRQQLDVSSYLELLLSDYAKFEENALIEFGEICSIFAGIEKNGTKPYTDY